MTSISLKVDPAQDRPWDAKLNRDLKTLGMFIEVYCKGQHPDAEKREISAQMATGQKATPRPLTLCPDCEKLLMHAFVKRTHCPMNPKPQCKHCPNHCYAPKYRAQIREVMKYSGMKLLTRGRLDYLVHLLF